MEAPRGHTPLVVRLAEVAGPDAAAVGTKAAGLARMLAAGLPVPAGFCVTGRAYRRHLEADGRLGRVRQALAGLANGSAADRDAALRDIRQAVGEPPLAADVREAVEQHWRALGEARVAVHHRPRPRTCPVSPSPASTTRTSASPT